MSSYEQDYRALVNRVITKGQYRECRNGETRALFAQTLQITELAEDQFPLLTQRRIFFNGVFGELAAFLRGATKLGEFHAQGCHYWNENAKMWPPNHGLTLPDMSIGQVYGAQWVNWRQTGYNQIAAIMDELYANPHGRRHILTSFDPLAEACLPPCHLMAQFFVNADGRLDCQVYMRSVDIILGLPSDVVLYAALLILVSNYVAMRPGVLTFQMGDTHIYENHVDTFISQQHDQAMHPLPTFELVANEVFDFVPKHLKINDYTFSETIRYQFNV
jgi:thymidylate synthase